MPRSKRSTLQCASLNKINTINKENLSPVASPPLLVPTSSLAALELDLKRAPADFHSLDYVSEPNDVDMDEVAPGDDFYMDD